MAVAHQRGRVARRHPDRLHIGAARALQKPRAGADRHLRHVGGTPIEILIGQVLVRLAHDLLPQLRGGIAVRADAGILVVADPHRCGVVRRIADEVAVIVAGGRTGLAGDGHAGEGRLGAGAAAHHALEQLIDRVRGGLLHRHPRLLLVLQHKVALVVAHLDVGARPCIHAIVGKGGVRRRHLDRVHAVGQAAEAERCGVEIAVDQRGEAEVLRHEVVGHGRRERLEHAHRRGIGGHAQRGLERDKTLVAAVGVLRPRFFRAVLVRLQAHGIVVEHRRRRDDAGIQRGRVDRDGLDGAAAGAGGGRVVEEEAALALADAARHRHDVARGVVDDSHAGLQLLALGRGVGQVARIGVNLLHDALQLRVDGRVDLIASGVEQLLGDLLGIVLLAVQRVDHVVEDLLDEIRIELLRGGLRHLLLRAVGGHIVVVPHEHQRLVDRRLVFRVVQIAELVHLVEHRLLPLLVLLTEGLAAVERALTGGVVEVGVLRDADDGRALGDGQVLGVLAEVVLGGRLNAVGMVAEVDEVQIECQRLLTRVILIEAQRLEDLRHLALDGRLVVAGGVLDDLLGDGRAAALRSAAGEHGEHRLAGRFPVHAVMLEEALVLDRHQSLPDMVGDVGKFNVRAVLGAVDLLQLLPLARALVLIIDDRALVERDGAHIHIQHRLERGVDILHKNAEEHQRRADADGQERAEHLQRRHAGAAPSVVFSRRTGGFVFPFHCATSFCELKKRSSALLSFDNR